MGKFDHKALHLKDEKKFIYTAFSKHFFYYRMFISKFVLEKGKVPLNPFMLFDYFLLDSLDRDVVRIANNATVLKADEVWVFGPVSDGVLAEIKIAKHENKTIRCFDLVNGNFQELPLNLATLESDVKQFQVELL